VAGTERRDEARQGGSKAGGEGSGGDLESRRQALDSALASRRPVESGNKDGGGTVSGVGNAFKLSSEFIAAIVVGAGIGWFLDRLAGTSPWGLIVFLLLGFAAGVVNVLRSAGLMAEVGTVKPGREPRRDDES
jgi:ATP synthase protein I